MTDAEPERVEAAPPGLAWTERLAAYAQHGPLPLVLLGLTVVTGVVDAVSYIALGHVFVANMTGNVVLLGFALAGAPGLSVSAPLTAMAAFLAGAAIGGALGRRIAHHRGALARTGIAAEVVLLGAAFVAALGAAEPIAGAQRYVGDRAAGRRARRPERGRAAHRGAGPDDDGAHAHADRPRRRRPLRGRAGVGEPAAHRRRRGDVRGRACRRLLTLHASPAAALALATAIAGAIALAAHRAARSRAGWAVR